MQFSTCLKPASKIFAKRDLQPKLRLNKSVLCSAQNEKRHNDITQRLAIAGLAALLLAGAAPEEALAARSGGRMGGGSFRSMPRSMPRASAGPSVRNYNTYIAPPLVSPYGFGVPFFGGGVMVSPFGIGGIFNILFIMFAFNVVLSVARNFIEADKDKDGKGKGTDSWDDEW
jgi:uncharacterized membrane protein